MLSIHLSIAEDPEECTGRGDLPVDAYRDCVDDLEEICSRLKLPSLLPNLFLASSLFKRLQEPPWNDATDEKVARVYAQLLDSFLCVDHHFHAVVTAMQRNGMRHPALVALDGVARSRGVSIEELCHRNPLLRDVRVCILFELDRHEDVIAACASLSDETFTQYPQLLEKFLRSFLTLQRYAEGLQLLQRTAALERTPSLAKAVSIASVEIGWWLYGEGRHEEAVAFIERVIPDEIHTREDVLQLYKSHQQMVKHAG
ncbi:MAG: hypothetical protein V1876_03285 [Candidatus Peregrinibacteria bacterium]